MNSQENFNKFKTLANNYRERTRLSSSGGTKDSYYKTIIDMGVDTIPFILADWNDDSLAIGDDKENLTHWFSALAIITKVSPVPAEDRGKIKLMKHHWIKFLKEQGYNAYIPS